jgi:hypothetical protein
MLRKIFDRGERLIVVAEDADADKMNSLIGERYGIDWIYSTK